MSDEVLINASLRFIFSDADRANAWLKAPNGAFSGQSPSEGRLIFGA
jgi:hypothetical protein